MRLRSDRGITQNKCKGEVHVWFRVTLIGYLMDDASPQ